MLMMSHSSRRPLARLVPVDVRQPQQMLAHHRAYQNWAHPLDLLADLYVHPWRAFRRHCTKTKSPTPSQDPVEEDCESIYQLHLLLLLISVVLVVRGLVGQRVALSRLQKREQKRKMVHRMTMKLISHRKAGEDRLEVQHQQQERHHPRGRQSERRLERLLRGHVRGKMSPTKKSILMRMSKSLLQRKIVMAERSMNLSLLKKMLMMRRKCHGRSHNVSRLDVRLHSHPPPVRQQLHLHRDLVERDQFAMKR
mmetsp:Transcript_1616/g.3859  ORF Transcript_1616/g.3859 Transcript_1616/m.3859 type:complete len:252 (-) Transcript_1616:74-829(-)